MDFLFSEDSKNSVPLLPFDPCTIPFPGLLPPLSHWNPVWALWMLPEKKIDFSILRGSSWVLNHCSYFCLWERLLLLIVQHPATLLCRMALAKFFYHSTSLLCPDLYVHVFLSGGLFEFIPGKAGLPFLSCLWFSFQVSTLQIFFSTIAWGIGAVFSAYYQMHKKARFFRVSWCIVLNSTPFT